MFLHRLFVDPQNREGENDENISKNFPGVLDRAIFF